MSYDSGSQPCTWSSTSSGLLTGLAFLGREPFLRATLFAAAGYQLVFAEAMFALIASLTAGGTSPAELGLLFAVVAVGGSWGRCSSPGSRRAWG